MGPTSDPVTQTTSGLCGILPADKERQLQRHVNPLEVVADGQAKCQDK